ncbi:TspO/MBR family protein [Sphingosinicella terrae]|uniref:TspO/MBR family protein n=1 Tax=Sphingosinicella terrae TaxID=2172047 RepID=UPI000E0DAFCF|nr:TspO/MBR family protein [Sphingosinicella terrae]
MMEIASRSQLRMSFLRWALVTVPLVLLLGTLSGRAANSGYGNPWFDALDKPSFMPPGWTFGAAWTLLYIFLGLALAMLLHARGARGRGLVVTLFLVQLAMNYAWSPLFFAAHEIGAALALILAMIALTIVLVGLAWRIRRGAALLMLPYLGWLCFAAALTFAIDRANPGASELAPGRASTDIRL